MKKYILKEALKAVEFTGDNIAEVQSLLDKSDKEPNGLATDLLACKVLRVGRYVVLEKDGFVRVWRKSAFERTYKPEERKKEKPASPAFEDSVDLSHFSRQPNQGFMVPSGAPAFVPGSGTNQSSMDEYEEKAFFRVCGADLNEPSHL